MPITVTIPNFTTKETSTKDAVISILSERWPLTAREICNSLERERGMNVSYQAVHKTLAQLEEGNIICKTGNNFELNKDWISQSHEFFGNLKNTCSENGGKYAIKPDFKEPIRMHFSDLSIFYVRMAEIMASNVLVGSGPKHGIAILRHGWFPLNFKFMDFSLLARMARNGLDNYAMLQKDTPFDRWIRKQYIRAGVPNTKIIGEVKDIADDILVQGDTITQCRLSDETKKLIDDVYERIDGISSLFKEFVSQKLSKQKASVDVTFTKNRELAELTRGRLIQIYREAP
ncbi:MAG: hypothetical protein V1676_02580 [Candidatus Diapherotrites archaeon]